jgi:hypothetical protein
MPLKLAAAFAAAILSSAVHAQENPAARYVMLSAPDCSGPQNIIAEAAAAPANVTHMRVQYMGDPGTPELAFEIANAVTWDAGMFTGLHAPWAAQRGYRDEGPPVAANAYQLSCGSAGFLVNTRSFSHRVAIFGAGPSVSVARALDPAPAPFREPNATLLLEANVSVPWVDTPGTPTGDGTAQVSFAYYARDATSGTTFAHVIGLFDNRDPSIAVAYPEGTGYDGEVAFAGSPLLAANASGVPTQFVSVSPYSATMRFVQPWTEPVFFRAEIPYEAFRKLLARLKAEAAPAMSADPADYRIILFGLLGEVFPGTGSMHEVSLGASVSDLALSIIPGRPRYRH